MKTTKLEKLINFTRNYFNTDPYDISECEKELTKSVPGWRDTLKNPRNWERIEENLPLRHPIEDFESSELYLYEGLWTIFVRAGGRELAKRWFFYSWDVPRQASRNWLMDNMDSDIWNALEDKMKKALITENCFLPMIHFLPDVYGDVKYDRSSSYLLELSRRYETTYKVRSVIKEAGDKKFLHLMDSLNFFTSIKELYNPNMYEKSFIDRLIEKISKNGYDKSSDLPSILVSLEPPPIFKEHPELEERECEDIEMEYYDIEKFLGVYKPVEEQIVIYARGITWWTKKYPDFDSQWLFSVVLIHEIAHWITHKLPHSKVPTWPTEVERS